MTGFVTHVRPEMMNGTGIGPFSGEMEAYDLAAVRTGVVSNEECYDAEASPRGEALINHITLNGRLS
jgi:hypothetical protein